MLFVSKLRSKQLHIWNNDSELIAAARVIKPLYIIQADAKKTQANEHKECLNVEKKNQYWKENETKDNYHAKLKYME